MTPCLDWSERSLFWRVFQPKNRGQIGSRYMCVYIYIFQYIQDCTDLCEVRRATLIFIDVHEVTSRFHTKIMQMDVVDVDISRILKATNCKKNIKSKDVYIAHPAPPHPKKNNSDALRRSAMLTCAIDAPGYMLSPRSHG